MWYCIRRYAFAVSFLGFYVHTAEGQTTSTQRIATGIDRPVFAVSPPGDSFRLFLAEQHTGRIEILELDTNNILATPFLDLNGPTTLAQGNEQGLLGLAFDSDYATNGYFYVNVTTSAGSGDTHIRRYQVQGDPLTSNVANPASQTEVLSFTQPQANHNGGWIAFSPTDGYLYIATGDGGGGNDNGTGHTAGTGNAQDITNNFLGKMLRIDVSGDDFPTDASRNYAIPANNPFVGVTGDDEIWAYGLRNPFRSSFDRATGDLWIGDVGQSAREEVDFQPADSPGGENYGWRLREGTIATPAGGIGGNRPPGNVEPVYDYTHGTGEFQGNVIIGGYLYRGPVAEFQGHYFFADSGSNNIWKLDPDAVSPRNSVRRINDKLTPDAGSIANIGSFGEDAAGNLYVMEVFGGELFRVVSSAQEIVWNGDDASAGSPGDGISWGSNLNWTRAGVADESFIANDHVIFAPGSTQATIDLQADRTVSAATFQADYTLAGNTLQVLSGNVTVDAGVTATIESTLVAEDSDQSIRKLGAGTMLVDGTAGQIAVKEGTLGGNGTLEYLTVRAGATVAPGSSIGTLHVDGSYFMDEGGTLSIEIAGTAPGEFDRLEVAGTAELAGTLDVSLLNGFDPQIGDSFGILFGARAYNGTFDVQNLPDLGVNKTWFLNPGNSTLFLEVHSAYSADFDQDGDVDGDDLTAWQGAYGAGNGADADGDGDSDGVDYLEWQRQFGSGLSAASVAVPEPGGLCLLALAACCVASDCCRRYL